MRSIWKLYYFPYFSINIMLIQNKRFFIKGEPHGCDDVLNVGYREVVKIDSKVLS